MYKWPILFDSKLYFFGGVGEVIRNYTDVTAGGVVWWWWWWGYLFTLSTKQNKKFHIEISKWAAGKLGWGAE